MEMFDCIGSPALSAGGFHSCGVVSGSGNGVCWGYDVFGQAKVQPFYTTLFFLHHSHLNHPFALIFRYLRAHQACHTSGFQSTLAVSIRAVLQVCETAYFVRYKPTKHMRL